MKTRIVPLILLLCLFGTARGQVEQSINVPTTSAASPTFPALLYLPDDYTTTGSQKYALLIFLHGMGESCPPLSTLYNNQSAGGPSYYIEHGQWPTTGFVNPKDGKTYKFIVVSPQSGCNGWSTSGDQLEYVIDYLVSKYRVDVNRIYGTGLSAGGGGMVEYMAHLNSDETTQTSVRTNKLAACVPMSSAINVPQPSWGSMIASEGTNLWGFGDISGADVFGEKCQALVGYVESNKPGTTKFTSYLGGHCCWGQFYDPNYRQSFTFQGVTSNMNIYEWMLISSRGTTPSSPAPTANAGSNQTVTLPLGSPVTLSGSGTAASGHSISSYKWTQTGGSAATINSSNSSSTTLAGLAAGTYTFQLTVTDDAGSTGTSTVTVTVNAAASPVTALIGGGSNQTITLPTNSIQLDGSGSTGTISLFSWTQVSGPATAGFSAASSNKTNATGLQQGTYVFQLSLNGGVSLATVTVTVNAAVTVYASPTINVTPTSASITTSTDNANSAYNLTGATMNSMKWTKFSVPGQKVFTIGVLGSSTSAGNGASVTDSSYVGRLTKYYTNMGVISQVYNLAYSGYNIWQAMPTGSTPPSDVTAKLSPSDVPDPTRNVTAMIAQHPDVVIVCFPSNGYDVLTIDEIMQPMQTIYNQLKAAGIDVYVTTSQPRQDAQFSDPAKQQFLQVVRDSVMNRFGAQAIDFYDAVATPGTTSQVPAYQYGDNIHFNDAGHLQLFNMVVGANIFKNLISSSAVIGSPTSANTSFSNLPNGVNRFQATVWDSHMQAASAVTTITVTGAAPSACGGHKYNIPPDPTDGSVYITHLNSSYKPGDTLALQGTYSAVDLEGLIGTNSCPIVIMNQGTQAYLSQRLNLDGCQYVKVTGSGSSDQYGIKIEQDPQLRQQSYHAIAINDKSKNVEVERVLMHNVDIGIVCETNESCDNSMNYPNWVLDSMSFHDNRIVGTWNEGMYIGNTSPDNASYDLRPVTCNGVTSYPAPMKNGYTRIYNNYVDSTGRGGIQLANATFGVSEIFGNTVKHNGLNGDDAQGTAISLGLYTRAYVHDNTISNTYTWGIASIGAGATNVPLRIENNTIDSSGYLRSYDLATTSRTVYDPRTEPTVAPQLAWPQAIEIDTRPRLYTTDSPNPGTAVKGQDSTQFWIKNNTIGLNKANIGVNIDDDYAGIQKVGNIICGNVNKNGTPAVLHVANGINYSTCSATNPPTAAAGSNQTITLPTNSVTLTGTGSAASGHTITYSWTQVSGPSTANNSNPTEALTTMSNLVQGTYTFRFTVLQNDGQSATSDLTVTVNPATGANQAPTANAGSGITITLPTSTTTLNGSGTDPDGSIAGYSWVQVSGPSTASLATANQAQTGVSGLVQGTYQFQLTVTDNKGATGSATVQVTVNAPAAPNQAPTANAGSDITITAPTSTTTLSGSGSDPDGSIAGYSWVLVSGPSIVWMGSSAQPTTTLNGLVPGVYKVRLTVTDDQGATGSAIVTVTVNAAPVNQAPTANAGSNITITLPTNTATLTGSGSDADGSIAGYSWTQIGGPSTAAIATAGQNQTDVNNLVQGTYTFQLTVTDNQGATGTATVTVTVNAASAGNQAPTANAGSNITITLPTNSATLTGSGMDPDGSIAGYSWSQVAGPSTAAITAASQNQTDVNNLVQGTYTFLLTVTDNQGATGSATVTVTVNAPVVVPNQSPTANAGSDITITLPTASTTLTGSGTDPDGSIASYSWVQIAGPSTAAIATAGQNQTDVNNLVQGTYTFQLTVTDNQGATGSATVKVIVNPPAAPNQSPTANAGADITVTLPSTNTTLTGSGTDPDGTITSYNWVLISGPSTVAMGSPDQPWTTVNGLVAGVYKFLLTVTDNQGASSSAIVTVTVVSPNQSPTANAGSNITITLPTNTATLTGSGSDPDGSIAGYVWTQVSGPSAAGIVSGANYQTTVNNLVQGVYTFQLTVTDNQGATGTATVTVTVNAPVVVPNQAPIANAGPDQNLTDPVNVASLDGSASYDPDGSITSYSWTQLSGAGGLTIANAGTAKPSIYGLKPGVYTFQLIVTDNQGATATDQVTVTVSAGMATGATLVADAGLDTTVVYPVTTGTLDGSGSYAVGGTIDSYKWTQLSGPAPAGILNSGAAVTAISALQPGVYEFKLTVTSGSQTASDVVIVKVISNLRHDGIVSLYPNPAQDVTTLKVSNSARGKVVIEIFDLGGRMISKAEYSKEGDDFTQTIPVTGLSRGSYLIRVVFEGQMDKPINRMLIKQ